jgi:transaldolase
MSNLSSLILFRYSKKTLSVIKKLSSEKIKLNITAVFDYKQIKGIKNNIDKNSNVIISIFSGRIADTGRDPEEIVSKAVKLFKGYNYVKILWASTREILNIFHAQRSNCHIITVPVVILKSLSKLNKNLLQYSQETVRQFYLDAKSSKFKV